ncbi:hypothetical protein HGA34_00185 [Candidatus Falkowbacteria bacterium]|nr:hypothetical protein [Candidatus Falkowbacteria bacterium]
MLTTNFCDKCGKNLSAYEERLFSIFLADHEEYGIGSPRTKLCYECQEPVLVFLRGYLKRKYVTEPVVHQKTA